MPKSIHPTSEVPKKLDAKAVEEETHSEDERDSDFDMTEDRATVDEIEAFLESWPELTERFRLLKKIGEGTFSSVYKAIDLKHDDYDNSCWTGLVGIEREETDVVHVALKRIYESSSAVRITTEIQMLADLSGSPCVVPLITAERKADQVIIVLPYFEHQDFRDYFTGCTIDDIRCYMRQLFTALVALHDRNIMHRDIKPSNFMYNFITKQGMLTDFGLAQFQLPGITTRSSDAARAKLKAGKIVSPATPKSFKENSEFGVSAKIPKNETRPSKKANRAGTRGFRAPEVLLKSQSQTTAIDIWSCGVTLLCFFTRCFPFFESNDDANAVVELASVFGMEKMEQTARLHNVDWKAYLPQIERKGTDFKTLCERVSGDPNLTKQIPREGYDLLERCLDLDPATRITAKKALNHPFLNSKR
ncbi:hypothetical protein HDU93_009028 [Gonapodya sp. JEL0774]|nr:hypothetical protein HDU93_009028 [Gonapodya sp. JEL0774]